MDHRLQQLAVHQVEALRVHIEHGQRAVGNVQGNGAHALDLRIVADPAQQAVGNARRAAGASGNLKAALGVGRHLQQAGTAGHDAQQFLRAVKLQPRYDAKAVAQGVGQHAGTRGGSHQSKGLQIELDRARRGALANHDVDLVVL